MNVGTRIIELRSARNLSGYKLAKLAEMSPGSLREIEIGNRKPTIPTLNKICSGLGITLAEFVSPLAEEPDFDTHLDGAAPPAQSVGPRRAELLRMIDNLPEEKLEIAIRVIKAL